MSEEADRLSDPQRSADNPAVSAHPLANRGRHLAPPDANHKVVRVFQ